MKTISFANISIPFLRSCSQIVFTGEHGLRKGIEILAKLVF